MPALKEKFFIYLTLDIFLWLYNFKHILFQHEMIIRLLVIKKKKKRKRKSTINNNY